MREILRENILNDLVVEEMVFSFKKMENMKTIMTLKEAPIGFVYNLFRRISWHLGALDSANQLVRHPFILENVIYLKISGDHGGSFKMVSGEWVYAGGKIADAKQHQNCIHQPMFDIPTNQVSMLPLHISLGVFPAIFNCLEDEVVA